jgi:hypothetical protein
MFIMFMLFNHHPNATYSEPAATPTVQMQPARAGAVLENDATAGEKPATYEELLPYLMLAIAI